MLFIISESTGGFSWCEMEMRDLARFVCVSMAKVLDTSVRVFKTGSVRSGPVTTHGQCIVFCCYDNSHTHEDWADFALSMHGKLDCEIIVVIR